MAKKVKHTTPKEFKKFLADQEEGIKDSLSEILTANKKRVSAITKNIAEVIKKKEKAKKRK